MQTTTIARLTNAQVQNAVWEAWNRLDYCGNLNARAKRLACEIGGFDPHELQAWIDAHTSEEICDLLM